jgi:hypothetical protein
MTWFLKIRRQGIFAVPLAAGILAGSLSADWLSSGEPEGSRSFGFRGNAATTASSADPHAEIHKSDRIPGSGQGEASRYGSSATAEDQLVLGHEWQLARELLDVGQYPDETLRTLAEGHDGPATIALLMRDRAQRVLSSELRNAYLTRLVARGEMNALYMAALPGPNTSNLEDQAGYALLWGRLNPARKREFERLYEQVRYFALLSGKPIDPDAGRHLADKLESDIAAIR